MSSSSPIAIQAIQDDGLISALRKTWGVDASDLVHRNRLDIPKDHGTGFVKAYRFKPGIYLTLFKGKTKAPLRFCIHMQKRTPILFVYQIKGNAVLDLYHRDNPVHIEPLDVAIAAPYGAPRLDISWPENKSLQFVLLAIERKKYQEHLEGTSQALPRRLSQLFRGGENRRSFYFQQHYGVHISRVLGQSFRNRFKPGLEDAYLEAKTLELLTLQFAQFLDSTAPNKRKVDIKPSDLDAIIKAKASIDENLSNPPTIPELARTVGVNVNKLKRGFKTVFNTTINRYTTGKRLELANQLLLQEDMPVGDVVFAVGYENRSYFARIFKEKYGMHPGQIRMHLETTVPSA